MKFMLCEKIEEKDLDKLNGDWKANIKYDGERIVAIVKNGEVFLLNRRGKEKNSYYAEIVEALKKYPDCILDGEVVSFDEKFETLQRRALTSNKEKQEQLRKEIPVRYMVFDILQFEGNGLTHLPLKERIKYFDKFKQEEYPRKINFVSYSEINHLLELTKRINSVEFSIEGLVIKNMDSKYQQRRSNDWLKLKFFKETEMRLTSYTLNNAGIRCEDDLGNAVQVAGKQHKEVKDRIDSVGYCEVFIQYLDITKENRFRFPSYRGLKNG